MKKRFILLAAALLAVCSPAARAQYPIEKELPQRYELSRSDDEADCGKGERSEVSAMHTCAARANWERIPK